MVDTMVDVGNPTFTLAAPAASSVDEGHVMPSPARFHLEIRLAVGIVAGMAVVTTVAAAAAEDFGVLSTRWRIVEGSGAGHEGHGAPYGCVLQRSLGRRP